MLNGGYWEGLKEYYETDYNGIMPGKYAEQYAKEMSDAGSTFLNFDRPFDPDEVYSWIRGTQEQAEDEYQYNNGENDGQGTSEIDKDYPNLWGYDGYTEEIAAYFLHKDLDFFRSELEKDNKEFIEEATRLEWMEMIESIPSVNDIFIF